MFCIARKKYVKKHVFCQIDNPWRNYHRRFGFFFLDKLKHEKIAATWENFCDSKWNQIVRSSYIVVVVLHNFMDSIFLNWGMISRNIFHDKKICKCHQQICNSITIYNRSKNHFSHDIKKYIRCYPNEVNSFGRLYISIKKWNISLKVLLH